MKQYEIWRLEDDLIVPTEDGLWTITYPAAAQDMAEVVGSTNVTATNLAEPCTACWPAPVAISILTTRPMRARPSCSATSEARVRGASHRCRRIGMALPKAEQ